jgi:hypothetical protein
MPEYGICQVENCEQPAQFAVEFDRQPRRPLQCCRDCADQLTDRTDEVTRLSD